jgi:hypothetical protein
MQPVAMAEHKFKIGERYFCAQRCRTTRHEGAYQIMRRLLASEGAFQYVIRSA